MVSFNYPHGRNSLMKQKKYMPSLVNEDGNSARSKKRAIGWFMALKRHAMAMDQDGSLFKHALGIPVDSAPDGRQVETVSDIITATAPMSLNSQINQAGNLKEMVRIVLLKFGLLYHEERDAKQNRRKILQELDAASTEKCKDLDAYMNYFRNRLDMYNILGMPHQLEAWDEHDILDRFLQPLMKTSNRALVERLMKHDGEDRQRELDYNQAVVVWQQANAAAGANQVPEPQRPVPKYRFKSIADELTGITWSPSDFGGGHKRETPARRTNNNNTKRRYDQRIHDETNRFALNARGPRGNPKKRSRRGRHREGEEPWKPNPQEAHVECFTCGKKGHYSFNYDAR